MAGLFISTTLLVFPSPQPSLSASPDFMEVLDTKDLVTAVVGGIVLALLLAIFKKVRSVYVRVLRKIARVGPWLADKWVRLKTPLPARVSKAEAALPARWNVKPDLNAPGRYVIKNLGPGKGTRVEVKPVDYSVFIEEGGFWHELDAGKAGSFRFASHMGLALSGPSVTLTWEDEAGEPQEQWIDLPGSFSY